MGRLKKGGMAIEEMTATSRLQDLHAYLLGVTFRSALMDWMRVNQFIVWDAAQICYLSQL
ncbi:MAG: hypothetical protein IPN81_04010 [Nitrosomonadales bacterium]|nr:hypothetical protein [Nitrosomonadales bacterium]